MKVKEISEEFFNLSIDTRVIDRIQNNKNLTSTQKVQMAKKFQQAKLAKQNEVVAIKNAASKLSDDELALNFINQNTKGSPYRIVGDASNKR